MPGGQNLGIDFGYWRVQFVIVRKDKFTKVEGFRLVFELNQNYLKVLREGH